MSKETPPTEPQTFDWQMDGGNDKSWGGKARSWIHDKPGRTRSLSACKTLAVWIPPPTQEPLALNLRGREEGARPELDTLASLRAAEGGSSRSYVLVPSSPVSEGSTPDSPAPDGTTPSSANPTSGAGTCSAHGSPECPCYDDVREVAQGSGWGRPGSMAGDGARAEPERDGSTVPVESAIDLLCGGFPCQDVSVAGQRRGLAGARSGLFHEFARIAGALRPRWLLVENVPGLLSSNGGRDFGVVLGTLADLGYGLGWRVLDSRYFGVPQRRRRVFVVGALIVDDPRAAAERAGQVLAVGSRCQGHPATRGEAGQDVAGTLGGGAGSRGWAQDTERMTFVPTVSYAAIGMGVGIGASVRRLTPTECERLQGLEDGWTNPDGTAPDSRCYAGLGNAVTATVGHWLGTRIRAADEAAA